MEPEFQFRDRSLFNLETVKVLNNGKSIYKGLVVWNARNGQPKVMSQEIITDWADRKRVADIIMAKTMGLVPIEECSEMECFDPQNGRRFELTIQPAENGYHAVIRKWREFDEDGKLGEITEREEEYIKDWMPETVYYGV